MSVSSEKYYRFNKHHPRILSIDPSPDIRFPNRAYIKYKGRDGKLLSCLICDVTFLDKPFKLQGGDVTIPSSESACRQVHGFQKNEWRMEVPTFALMPAHKLTYNPYKGKSYV